MVADTTSIRPRGTRAFLDLEPPSDDAKRAPKRVTQPRSFRGLARALPAEHAPSRAHAEKLAKAFARGETLAGSCALSGTPGERDLVLIQPAGRQVMVRVERLRADDWDHEEASERRFGTLAEALDWIGEALGLGWADLHVVVSPR